jgi:hypothetical protein
MTPDELADIRQDATFTAERAGAPGSPVRLRAEATLRLLDAYEALRVTARTLAMGEMIATGRGWKCRMCLRTISLEECARRGPDACFPAADPAWHAADCQVRKVLES